MGRIAVCAALLASISGPTHASTTSDPVSYAPIVVPSSDAGAIVGLVLDPDAHPVEGANVTAVATPRTGYLGLFADAPGDTVASATSDATGHFRVAVSRARMRELRVRSKEGLVAYVPSCAAGEAVTVTLAKPAQIAVRVFDAETSEPLAGVELAAGWIEPSVLRQFDTVPHRIAAAVTGTDGVARFTELPPVLLDITYEPHATGLRVDGQTGTRPWRALAGESSTLAMPVSDRYCTVHGRVVDRMQNPIPGARVSPSIRFERSVEADGDGRFVISAFAADEGLTLFAHQDSYALGSYASTTPAERAQSATIVLLSGRTVRGRVVDPAGQGIVGARIALVDHSTTPRNVSTAQDLVFARTQENGAFVVYGLRADVPHALLVSSAQHALCVRALPDNELGTPDLNVGAIVLEAPSSLAGTFVDAFKKPIAGGEVTLTIPQATGGSPTSLAGPGEFPLGSAQTDSAGRFRFEGLPSGALTVIGVTRAAGQRELIRLGGADKRQDVVVQILNSTRQPDPARSEVGGSVVGRAVDHAGNAAPRTAISVYTEDPFSSPVRTTFADERGVFVLDSLPAARYRAVLELRDGFADATPLRARRFLSVDEFVSFARAAPDSDARTLKLARILQVRGHVVDPVDARPRSWLVNVSSSANAAATACVASDASGHFVFAMEEGAALVLMLTPLGLDAGVPHSALDAAPPARFLVRDVVASTEELQVTVPH